MNAARVRRALVAGAALAVTLAAAIGVHVWFDAPSFPLAAPAVHQAVRGQGEVGGNTLVFRDAVYDPDDVGAPKGTRVLAVRFDVTEVSDTGCAPPSCSGWRSSEHAWARGSRRTAPR